MDKQDQMENIVVKDTKLYQEERQSALLKEKESERFNQRVAAYTQTSEYQQKLTLRAKVQDAAADGRPSYLEARARLHHLCSRPDDYAEGCIFFIENFGWTASPKTEIKHFPFILFEFQKDEIRWVIDHIEKGQDAFIEKSRDMGVSWIVFVYVSLWYWLFRDGVNILIGSYKEMLVDDGTIDSLFGKLDYSLDGIPKWLLPKGFDKKKHRTKLKLKNSENSNFITGDTMNPNFGRGSRKTAIMFDELGFWDYSKDAWEGTADSTNCRIANSTPNGYNYYAMLRESGIDVLTLHWKKHPFKDDEWYEYEKMRRTEEFVAQEIDISYTRSLEGKVYPEWNNDHVEQGLFEYDPNLPLFVGWDFGFTDDTAIIWCQPKNGQLRIVDTFAKAYKLIDFFIPFVTGIVSSDGYTYTAKELEKIESHKYWKIGTHFGDPAGRFGNQVTNSTVLDTLKNSGIRVNFKDEWKYFNKRKTAARLLIMDGIQLNQNSDTKHFNLTMINAAYPKVKNQGVDEIKSKDPKHDWTSHLRSAFEYLALGLSEFTPIKRVPYDKFKPTESNRRGKALSY